MRPVAVKLPLTRVSHFVPAGCLHWPIGEKDLIKQWVREVKELDNAYTVLMGDTQDAERTHYRDHLRSYRADQNSQLAIDRFVRRDVEDLARLLTPIKDRILGAILGNHYHEFSDGTNTEQYLCQLLGLRYLGPVGIIRIDYCESSTSVRHSLVIYAHHHGGSAGGRTTGGDMAALERSELAFDADIYALSHTHRRGGFKIPKLGLTRRGEPRVVENTKALVRTGAFLKGFGEERAISTGQIHLPSYAEQRGMRPTDLGWVKVKILLEKQNWKTAGRNGEGEWRRKIELSY